MPDRPELPPDHWIRVALSLREVLGELLEEWQLTLDGAPMRGTTALVRAGAHRRRATGRAQGRLPRTTRPSTSTSRSSTGTATAPSSCCAPTRTAGRCCSSGCTPRT